jgi:hypothetical protein
LQKPSVPRNFMAGAVFCFLRRHAQSLVGSRAKNRT